MRLPDFFLQNRLPWGDTYLGDFPEEEYMKKKIVIIGAGPGGYTAAVRAAQKGGDVTLIERENPGGTCLNRGCIPSKIMKTTADMLDKFGHCTEFGIHVEGRVSVVMKELMERKKRVLKVQRQGIMGLLKHHDVQYIQGNCTAGKKDAVSVTREDGSVSEIPYDNLILAMGSSLLNIPDFPFDGKKILSSDDVLCLEKVPQSILIVGGGVIGCEFAFILAALGSRVIVVEAQERLLPVPSVDDSCSKLLLREMKKRKIKVYTGQAVERVEEHGQGLKVYIKKFLSSAKEAQSLALDVDTMAVCIGRASNGNGIGLETIGVTLDKRGWISVNDKMETSAPGVYAIGDVLGPDRVMLAHVAATEGEIAVDNIFGGNCKMRYDVIPGGIFTMPEIGNVGITEAQAKEKGYDFRADKVLFRTLGKAQVIGEIAGEAKIISHRETGKILGVHIIGPHATDLLAEGVLAIQKGTTVRELSQTIHAHPTLSEIMLEASFRADDRSLHG